MTASLQVGPRLERPPHWRDPGDSRRASLKPDEPRDTGAAERPVIPAIRAGPH